MEICCKLLLQILHLNTCMSFFFWLGLGVREYLWRILSFDGYYGWRAILLSIIGAVLWQLEVDPLVHFNSIEHITLIFVVVLGTHPFHGQTEHMSEVLQRPKEDPTQRPTMQTIVLMLSSHSVIVEPPECPAVHSKIQQSFPIKDSKN
ncbi:hypothetical protein RJT34_25223 [Clitoria ternatea]|uniref:Uncharacterized protein n=1 Tax=Clitoria ternatea TaxID=43366 RepID=A0AAN9FS47_CLITE